MSNEMIKWEEELEKQAKEAAAQEAHIGGGEFFSLKSGKLSLGDSNIPDNQMGVVILDAVIENTYYEGSFNPDVISTPTCYAFGRDDATMAPHEAVESPVAQLCVDCEKNQWGSAATGRGKACRNRRRMAMIPGGLYNGGMFHKYDKPEDFEKSEVAFLALPPTSLGNYATYVKNLASTIKRPPHGVITKVKVVDDKKTQFKVTFELIDTLDSSVLPVVFKRHDEMAERIIFPYQKVEIEAKKESKPRKF